MTTKPGASVSQRETYPPLPTSKPQRSLFSGCAWVLAHVLVTLVSTTILTKWVDGNPLMGRIWGGYLVVGLPILFGAVQYPFIRNSFESSWAWGILSIFALPLCLLQVEGWGVVPMVGFGLGLAQATLVRPRGFWIMTLWVASSGLGWFAGWYLPLALHQWSWTHGMVPRIEGLSPWVTTSSTGLVYGLATAPFALWHPVNSRPWPGQWPRSWKWVPAAMHAGVNGGITFHFILHFGKILRLRDGMMVALFGNERADITQYTEFVFFLIPLFATEVVYQVVSQMHRRLVLSHSP